MDALRERHPSLDIVAFDGSLAGIREFDAFIADGARVALSDYQLAVDAVDTLDPALIVYTSGSTGSPKGAVLTHYGLSFGATMQTIHFDVDDPSLVVSFPINHVASVADTCATTLVRGGKIVFLEQFDPVKTIQATAAERCTMIGGVPTMYQLQMSAPGFESADLSSVELMLWGGAAMPKDLITRLQNHGARLMTAYGMTETATHVTYTDAGADLEVLASTVGRPDPNCEIRIATDDGQASNESNTGEIQLRADFLMAGYWNREDATRASYTDDGWFRTGDVGYFRDDGNLRLVGRMSDMFKSGGYNVYPREIESVLEQHAGVALAAVVAVPDDLYQEVGCAWIRMETGASVTAEELDAWCHSRLANYKVPKSFRIVDELPLLPVGKVDKPTLRKWSVEAGDR
jgi:acyl-CoA synthetase (AMP-forming)/AMP-acid ligase II